MCLGRFRAYGVHPDSAGRSALLTGYQLLFNKESTDGSGKANLGAHEGSETWGVVYALSDADLRTLDDGEVGYRRVKVPVCLADNIKVDAWVYIAKQPNNDLTLRPYAWYKRFLVEGATEHSLPKDYIAALAQIEAQNDTNERRDRKKRALSCRAES
jgi:gamma-glutamylcyclotransferase